jgi:hypothetical protein
MVQEWENVVDYRMLGYAVDEMERVDGIGKVVKAFFAKEVLAVMVRH